MTEQDSNTQEIQKAPLFKRFQWHNDAVDNALIGGSVVMNYASKVRDIAGGACEILQIVEHDELAMEGGDRPLFSRGTHAQLMRMALTSLQTLVEDSEHIAEWAYERHTDEGKAKRLARTW